MKRLLLDTNIYGEMVIDSSLEIIKKGLSEHPSLVIFGIPLIRMELRATSKTTQIEMGNLRIRLLGLYDILTKQRILSVGKEVEELAMDYFLAYKECGGALGQEAMKNDFLLVACAVLKNLDIVVSNDERSMKSSPALRAYTLINTVKKLPRPSFLSYEEFKNLLR